MLCSNRGAYTALVSQLRPISSTKEGPNTFLNVGMQGILLLPNLFLPSAPLPHHDRSAYKKVWFWTEKEYKDWKATAEGQAIMSKSQTAYLEDEDGKQLPEKCISKILSTMREIWHDLCCQGQIDANTMWTSMPLSIKKIFRTEIAGAHNELALCEDLWKADNLAKQYYASYKQTWFTNKDKKSIPSKHKADAKLETTDVNNKHTKVDAGLPEDISFDAEISPLSVSPLADVSSDFSEASTSTSNPKSNHSGFFEPKAREARPLPKIKDVLVSLAWVVCAIAPLGPPTTSPAEHVGSSVSQMVAPAVTPMSAGSSVSITPTVTPMSESVCPPPQTSPAEASGAANVTNTITVPPPSQPSSTVTSDLTSTASETLGPSKKKAWHPGSNKSAWTLCAHQWLKMVSPNGTQEELNTYYNQLPTETKEETRMSNSLPIPQSHAVNTPLCVGTGVWTNSTAETIAKCSGGTVY
ncbi:hypothetical protein F5J12DRAFT_898191 [Pisolithus orientalis]|uniref:uncharacterized protein n=1 Tax=Pisolithus orientalis TaxID=936130 RepID=UPI00222536A0|nr:uncharacterized protein F5J12DRAFT_898191 [Pisolithus orientalis]KAI5988458.1 hypothetical protein F5J12DRAFT_898191 [Pisolithus orientalis]